MSSRSARTELTFTAGVIGKGSRLGRDAQRDHADDPRRLFPDQRVGHLPARPARARRSSPTICSTRIISNPISRRTTLALAGLPASDLGIIGDRRRGRHPRPPGVLSMDAPVDRRAACPTASSSGCAASSATGSSSARRSGSSTAAAKPISRRCCPTRWSSPRSTEEVVAIGHGSASQTDVPIIAFGAGTSIEGNTHAGARRGQRSTCREMDADRRGQCRGFRLHRPGRRPARAAERASARSGPVLPDRSRRQRDDRRHGLDPRLAAPTRCATARCARRCCRLTRGHARRPRDPHRAPRAQVGGGLRPDPAV